jgi:OOP family OmpA-OmpF porin
MNRNAAGGQKSTGIYEEPVVLLEVLDVEAMDDSMVFVSADGMAGEIGSAGHVSPYGIYFDFDCAALKPQSDETLKEIASLMNNDPALGLHVVGHTDNQDSVQYNPDQSNRRARSAWSRSGCAHGVRHQGTTGWVGMTVRGRDSVNSH